MPHSLSILVLQKSAEGMLDVGIGWRGKVGVFPACTPGNGVQDNRWLPGSFRVRSLVRAALLLSSGANSERSKYPSDGFPKRIVLPKNGGPRAA